MNFMKAVEAMKQGKKVRQKCWDEDDGYLFYENQYIFTSDRNTIDGYAEWFTTTDWEVVEEKKTLWDKRRPFVVSAECGGFDYDEDDVKEALKEFIESEPSNYWQENIVKRLKEIFGEELLGEKE